MAIEQELEADLKWREAELAILKALSLGSPEADPRGRSLRRAYLALLYAHYEGFTKFAWETYLIQLQKDPCNIDQLCHPLQVLFSQKLIAKLKSTSSSSFIEATRSLIIHLGGSDKSYLDVPETSNLWPNVFCDTAAQLGLRSDYIEDYRQDLKALVSRRNDVAHGKKVEVDDASLARLEKAVWQVLIGLSVELVDRVAKKDYLLAAPNAG